jgi:hypothetical protein
MEANAVKFVASVPSVDALQYAIETLEMKSLV